MKYKCPACGAILTREAKDVKNFLTPKGYYRTRCGNAKRDVVCRPIKRKVKP